MMDILRGRAALVTGAGGGIGLAIAQRLAGHGVNLVLCGRDGAKLEAACAQARSYGVRALSSVGDLTDRGAREACVRLAQSEFGRLDVLVNNAGVAQSKPFDQVSEAEFDRIMSINAKTPFFLTQRALPLLRRSDAAAILNIGSVVSHKGYALQSAYAASKHALLGFSKVLAGELYREGIRVHVICPGGVYTDMVKVARPDLSPEGLIGPEDIADIAEFLLTHRGNAVVDEIQVHRAGKAPFA